MSMNYTYQLIDAPHFETDFLPAVTSYFNGNPELLIAYAKSHAIVTDAEITENMKSYEAENDWIKKTRGNPEFYKTPYLFPDPPPFDLYSAIMIALCKDIDIEVSSVAMESVIKTSNSNEPDPTLKRTLDLIIELGPFARGSWMKIELSTL